MGSDNLFVKRIENKKPVERWSKTGRKAVEYVEEQNFNNLEKNLHKNLKSDILYMFVNIVY